MKRRLLKTFTPILLLSAAVTARAANWPDHPQLRAVRVASGPKIDGDLSDDAWQSAPEFTDFTQHDPDDMKPATLSTSLRIVYDDDAIYFGAKMTDTAPPTSLLVRRDNFSQSDFLSINVDPQLDRLSGNAFTISPANVQVDTVLYNDIGEDSSWDGVWESATHILPDGWVAEVRIPFSQLRFPDKDVHVWGINITRRTVRRNETVRIVNTPKGQTGFVSHFADLVGIEGIHRGRPVEVLPYVVSRGDLRSQVDRNDPFISSREATADAGLDLKYALTSSLTLTGTLNPDFGQVEVDPAVVNLSEFETFYPEKRPFFTEGANVFNFGSSPAPSHWNFIYPPSVFYTRRIGRAPQLLPRVDPGAIAGNTNPDNSAPFDTVNFLDAPSQTRILGAAKVTGRLAGGWSLGVLDAVTDSERARFMAGGESGRVTVEPMTNYFVSRMTKELVPGSRVGFVLTSVNRKLDEDVEALRNDALTAGVDGYTSFGGDRNWILEGAALGTRINGTAESIAIAQRSPARYYQRPDAESVHYDPTRTSLDGWSGRLMLSKAKGTWRPILSIQSYSPGFETNDVGYMQRTDIVSAHAVMQYVNQNVTKNFREKNLWMATWQNSNFDGDKLERGVLAQAFGTLSNYWKPEVEVLAWEEAFSDSLTRGGPVARVPGGVRSEWSLTSDDRKKLWFEAGFNYEHQDDGTFEREVGIQLNARPASNLQLSIEPDYTMSHRSSQYVTAFGDTAAMATYGKRYVFAELEQHSFELGTRVDWTLTPKLSFQLYLQPFVASGEYHDYHSLVAARTRDYSPYAYNGPEPDFNVRSVRGSAVVRWEFRPGSALYVAWNENREGFSPTGDFRLGHDLQAIPDAPSHDVFMVKLSYWLPM